MDISQELQFKLDRLKEFIGHYKRVAIGYSGGVDSSLLATVCHEVLGPDAIAVTADASVVPRSEIRESQTLAKNVGFKQYLLPIDVWANPKFVENGPKRCYYCKYNIFTQVLRKAQELNCQVVFDGTNTDDTKEYRPGLQALAELGVKSPLLEAGLSKQDIRLLSERYGLATAHKPSMACLATRIPTDTAISKEALAMVEQGEEILKRLGVSQYRLRLFEDRAQIECGIQDFPTILANRKSLNEALHAIGISKITLDLEGYGSGHRKPSLEDQ